MNWHDTLARRVHNTGLTIAIDGPAGSGKSTLGRSLATELGIPYVDTGLMYRALTWKAYQCRIRPTDQASLLALATSLAFGVGNSEGSLLIDGAPPVPELRSSQVDTAVSTVSAHPTVRNLMVEQQRRLAQTGPVVMVGRDIGTVVLPDADIKFWVTASPETRAFRRLAEGLEGPLSGSQEETLRGLIERDRLDSTRTTSPLRQADDAIVIETDGITPDEAVRQALVAVAQKV